MQKITDLYQERALSREIRDRSGQVRVVHRKARLKRRLTLVPYSKRLANLLVDQVLIVIFSKLLVGYMPTWPFELVLLILSIGYYTFTEYYFQQTLGKFFTKTKVINRFGNPPSLEEAFFRALIRCIPFEWFSFLNEERGWHDSWTKTYVLSIKEVDTIAALMEDSRNFEPGPVSNS